jgi:hypothetical protein
VIYSGFNKVEGACTAGPLVQKAGPLVQKPASAGDARGKAKGLLSFEDAKATLPPPEGRSA